MSPGFGPTWTMAVWISLPAGFDATHLYSPLSFSGFALDTSRVHVPLSNVCLIVLVGFSWVPSLNHDISGVGLPVTLATNLITPFSGTFLN